MDRKKRLTDLAIITYQGMCDVEREEFIVGNLVSHLDEEMSDDELIYRLEELGITDEDYNEDYENIYKQNGFDNEADFWAYKEG